MKGNVRPVRARPTLMRGSLRTLTFGWSAALVVWGIWWLLIGPRYVELFEEHWPIAVTMAFGSLVGGGTSEGGGAIGFPVLTKILGVPADQARTFTFAIQSLGMGAASFSILASRIPVEWRCLRHGVPAAATGVVVGVLCVAPWVPLPAIRVLFTVLLAALGLALVVQWYSPRFARADRIPVWSVRERVLVVVAGALGGVLSGVAGVGENTVMFMLLVLLFRVCEKVSTPTTVILMTTASWVAFGLHVWVLRDFVPPVSDYWLTAVPVVVVGGPLGAWLCSHMSPGAVRGLLLVLIAIEVVSTVLLVPFTPSLVVMAGFSLALAVYVCFRLIRSPRYARGSS